MQVFTAPYIKFFLVNSFLFTLFLKLFNNWLESAREDLMDMFSVHTVEEIVVRNVFLSLIILTEN